MTLITGIFVMMIPFLIGLAFLILGIVGTIVTSKIKHSPKVLRVLSIIALGLGIALWAIAFILLMIGIAVAVFNFA